MGVFEQWGIPQLCPMMISHEISGGPYLTDKTISVYLRLLGWVKIEML